MLISLCFILLLVWQKVSNKVAGLMREAFRQDTLKAWEEYRPTGLHLTADEADAWLAQLEHGNDIEPPECHA